MSRLEAREVTRRYPSRAASGGLRGGSADLVAVDRVTLAVQPGERVGLVGESGSGKSTLGRLLLGLEPPSAGTILYGETDLSTLKRDGWRQFRREVQVVFQDPFASLNPRMTIGAALREALEVNGIARGRAAAVRAVELLERVGVAPVALRRFPHEFSGGQRQRLGIARALTVNPHILIADEPVSALDVSVQARVLALLRQLQGELGLGYLFISHDLAVIRQMCDRVAVMRDGRIVEEGRCADVFAAPADPYTKALLAAVPRLPSVPHPQV